MKLKLRLEYSAKTLFFELKLFFQRPLENFLWTLCTCSRYWKGPLNLFLCVSKTIVAVRHTNAKILTKSRQKNRFCITSLGMTVAKHFKKNFHRFCMFFKELVHFCEKLPDTNLILVHDMRLKTVHMGHLKPEKKLSRGLPTTHQVQKVS